MGGFNDLAKQGNDNLRDFNLTHCETQTIREGGAATELTGGCSCPALPGSPHRNQSQGRAGKRNNRFRRWKEGSREAAAAYKHGV